MYKQLKEKIEKSRYGRPRIANNTWARFKERGGMIEVILHESVIVEVSPNDEFWIYSDGYRTDVTKRRINEFSPAGVFQKNHEWYLRDGRPFEEGVMV